MQRRALLKSIGAGAATTIAGGSLSGCLGQAANRGLPQTVTVGYPSPALPVYNFALFPGLEKQLSDRGAGLEMKQFKGYTPMVSGLMAGEISVGVLSLTSLMRARAEDFPVVAPAGYTREYAFALVTAPEIERWEDLRGRTVALHSPNAVSTVTGRVMVDERLDYSAAVDYEFIIGTPNRLSAIKSGEVDAAVVFVSGALQAEREGFARTLGYPWEFDRLADQSTVALVTTEEALENRPEAVERIVGAATESYERLYAADAATITEQALETGQFSEFPQEVWIEAFEQVREAEIWPRGRGLEAEAVDRATQVLLETGMITEDQQLPREAFVAEDF
jgi:ABC-type nitrate/sulfonate/bicarbonate transport system substrate-binding protein